MEMKEIHGLISRINGCTFASLDTITIPAAGVRIHTTGTLVILFTNKKTRSGYENMVRRRLADSGLDPSTFNVDDLPWGERIPSSPLIRHTNAKGKTLYYLQTVLLKAGTDRWFIGTREVPRTSVPWARDNRAANTKQRLAGDRQVIVNTYMLASIERITLMGETVNAKESEHAFNVG